MGGLMQYQGEQLRCLLALVRIPTLATKKLLSLLFDCVDLTTLFDRQGNCQITQGVANWSAVEQDLRWAEKPNCHLLTLTDPAYPALLRQTTTLPPVLFVHGNVTLLSTPQIAIVGSRYPSPEGLENARRFAYSFSAEGITVTSGLALGIDGAAHHGALQNTGRTLAVMGHGLDHIYPMRHRALADRILEQGGGLVSEFPLGVKPVAAYFPQRNRIISGLSLGTLVVEAALRSGSLITARFALEQGREVFAIPGSVHSPLTKGCHALIRQGAKLVEVANDVLEELDTLFGYVAETSKT